MKKAYLFVFTLLIFLLTLSSCDVNGGTGGEKEVVDDIKLYIPKDMLYLSKESFFDTPYVENIEIGFTVFTNKKPKILKSVRYFNDNEEILFDQISISFGFNLVKLMDTGFEYFEVNLYVIVSLDVSQTININKVIVDFGRVFEFSARVSIGYKNDPNYTLREPRINTMYSEPYEINEDTLTIVYAMQVSFNDTFTLVEILPERSLEIVKIMVGECSITDGDIPIYYDFYPNYQFSDYNIFFRVTYSVLDDVFSYSENMMFRIITPEGQEKLVSNSMYPTEFGCFDHGTALHQLELEESDFS
jgi:hypothetical protein